MPEFNENNMTLTFLFEDDEGLETPTIVPAVFKACYRCDGRGRHSLAVDGHGITAEEWQNEWSFDEQESYLAGEYDRGCEVCKGKRVVPEVNWDALELNARNLLENYYLELREADEIERMERRYGA